MYEAATLERIWNHHAESNAWFDSNREFELVPTDKSQRELFAEATASPRPDYNGSHLINPAGTIWTVVDGYARGWVSEALFLRVHYWSRNWCSGTNPRVCGTTRIRLTPVQTIDWIAELPPWNDDVGLVRNPAGTVAIIETPRGEADPVLYGVPSERVMNYYQLNWDNVRPITNDEFNHYTMRTILRMPDGSV